MRRGRLMNFKSKINNRLKKGIDSLERETIFSTGYCKTSGGEVMGYELTSLLNLFSADGTEHKLGDKIKVYLPSPINAVPEQEEDKYLAAYIHDIEVTVRHTEDLQSWYFVVTGFVKEIDKKLTKAGYTRNRIFNPAWGIDTRGYEHERQRTNTKVSGIHYVEIQEGYEGGMYED